MKKNVIFALTLLFTLSASLGALAMNHEPMEHGCSTCPKKDHGSMEMKDDMTMNHEKMEHHSSMGSMKDHGSMGMKGDMAMLGNDIKQNVKAMAHLKDVRAAMAGMEMNQTHHFMVMLMDTETGEPIEQGSAALKIVSPSGKEGGPVKLMGMQGHFGADITLNEKGDYRFTVGTKLADGEKRQFEFAYTLE